MIIEVRCLAKLFGDGQAIAWAPFTEFDVMTMAGHASFETTRRYEQPDKTDLLARARKARSLARKSVIVATPLQVPIQV